MPKDTGIIAESRKKERVAIVIGGSILARDELEPDFIRRMAAKIMRLAERHSLYVVVGGGAPARKHIRAARDCGVKEERLDLVGIQATRLNAQTMVCVLEKLGASVNIEIPHTVEGAIRLSEQCDIVVMGGTVPGHSTDYVAVELAVKAHCARLVNATNVDGVYERDPKKDPRARRLPKMSFDGLLEVVKDFGWTAAGSPGVMDGPATVFLAQNAIPTCVVLGTDLQNFGRAVAGRPFRGTRITGAKATAWLH